MRRTHQDVYRRSLARHLTNAGGAAALQRHRGTALRYLLRSLSQSPLSLPTWKWIVKTLVLPHNRLTARSRPRPAGAVSATQ